MKFQGEKVKRIPAKRNETKAASGIDLQQLQSQIAAQQLFTGQMGTEAGSPIQSQAVLLSGPPLSSVQRQTLAVQISRTSGNLYLQRVMTQMKEETRVNTNIPSRPIQVMRALQRQEEFNFSDEEGMTIEVPVEDIGGRGAGAGEREVEAEIVKLRGWVGLFLSAYRDGLNSFSDTMKFASDEDARPRYFDVALKEVGKILLDELINYATTGMPIVGPVVKGAKSVLTALYNEAKRAEAAQGEARIRNYIVSTRNAITQEGGIHRQLLEVMDSARPQLLDKYQTAVESSATGAPEAGAGQELAASQGTHGHLTGEAATFVRELKSQVEQFKAQVPDAAEFQRRFTEQFADTPGRTAPVSQGGLESGSLHLNMELYREQEGSGDSAYWSYQIENTDSSWQLATSAPKSSNLAQSLKDTIGGSVANTSLPKYLHVRVETEVDWGLNDYGRAVIYFRDPDRPEFRGWDETLSRWVWGLPRVKQRALSVTEITAG